MYEALRNNDTRRLWQIARRIGGYRWTAKHQCRNIVVELPSCIEWDQHLQKPAIQGGFGARRIYDPSCEFYWDNDGNIADPFCSEDFNRLIPATVIPHEQAMKLAAHDLNGILQFIKSRKCGKQVPEWSTPLDYWRFLLTDPGYVPQMRLLLFQLCFAIRCSGRFPWVWNYSSTAQIPKYNNKSGIPGTRIIHKLDPIGKAFIAHIWSSCDLSKFNFAFACVKHRCREQALLQQSILHQKLRQGKASYLFTKFDVRNAFPSLDRNELVKHINACALEQNKNFLIQRVSQARMQLCVSQHSPCFYALGSGVMPGDSIAGDLFGQLYNSSLFNAFQELCAGSTWPLTAKDPLSGQIVDISATTFADDLAKTDRVKDLSHAAAIEAFNDHIIAKHLDPIGLVMHSDKKQTIMCCSGRRRNDIINTRENQPIKYLGKYFTADGRENCEIKQRLMSARMAWYRLLYFWGKKFIGITIKLSIYKSAVQSVLLSALHTAVRNHSQINRLEQWRMKCIRKIIGRRAFHVFDLSASNIKSFSNNEIRQFYGLPTIKSLLCYRRLQLVQRWQNIQMKLSI